MMMRYIPRMHWQILAQYDTSAHQSSFFTCGSTVEKLVYVRTNNMQFMKQDAKQRFGGVGQLTCFEDEEDDYIDIESDGDSCQSADVGS